MKIIKRENSDFPTFRPLSIWDDFFKMDEFLPSTSFKSLNADLWEDKENVWIKMAMPGIKNDDIKVEIHDDVVTLSGNSSEKEEKKDDGKRYYFKSMEASFEQSFRLPSKVNSDKAEAKLENGILTVKLPKAEDAQPKVIKVN